MGKSKDKVSQEKTPASITEEEQEDQELDSQDGIDASTIPPTPILTGSSVGSAAVSEKRPISPSEVDKESKKQRRIRLANTDLMEVIRASSETETIISVEELLELKGLVATLAKDNARVQEEITSMKNQPSSAKTDTAYGFFNDVLLLQNSNDVTKPKILAVISQFRNPLFLRDLKTIIQHRAKRILDFEFTTEGYAASQEVVDFWTNVEYINNLEKLYQNTHLDTTTLSRFSKIKLAGLYVSGKINPSLINSILEADELMTDDDRNSLSLQKSLIGRAYGHLSQLEPARINLAPEVAQCCSTIPVYDT